MLWEYKVRRKTAQHIKLLYNFTFLRWPPAFADETYLTAKVINNDRIDRDPVSKYSTYLLYQRK